MLGLLQGSKYIFGYRGYIGQILPKLAKVAPFVYILPLTHLSKKKKNGWTMVNHGPTMGLTMVDRAFEKWYHSQKPWSTMAPFLKSIVNHGAKLFKSMVNHGHHDHVQPC